MADVIVGRSESAIKKHGKKGCILLGKQYVEKANEIKLEDNIYLDVSGAHVMLICGKRGGGKTYTMGVIAEGFADLDCRPHGYHHRAPAFDDYYLRPDLRSGPRADPRTGQPSGIAGGRWALRPTLQTAICRAGRKVAPREIGEGIERRQNRDAERWRHRLRLLGT